MNISTTRIPKISIIMPVYNGEVYLRDTLESIIAQSYQDFELLIVDDTSTDNSYEILLNYSQRDSRIKLFTKPNGGNAVKSIIFALPLALGEWMFYSSQDDLFSKDLLENMYFRALETDADAIIPDMVWYEKGERASNAMIGINNGVKKIILSGRDAFIQSLNVKIHGFSLRRMDLVKKIGYDELLTNSDEYATRKFYLNCRSVTFSNGTFYYNQGNKDGLTQKFTPKAFDWILTDLRLIDLSIHNDLDKKLIDDFALKTLNHTHYLEKKLSDNLKHFSESEILACQAILKESRQKLNIFIKARKIKKIKKSFYKKLKTSFHKRASRLLNKKIKLISS